MKGLVTQAAAFNDAMYARQPPRWVMSCAPCVARASHTKPCTLLPSASTSVPMPSGAGISARKEPISDIGIAQTSTAMAVLSGLPVARFKTAVVNADVTELSKIKGLGKKTAERIILELKDKVGVTETWVSAAGGGISHAAADAEMALIALGYKQVDARKAVKKVLEIEANASVEELIRGALRLMP